MTSSVSVTPLVTALPAWTRPAATVCRATMAMLVAAHPYQDRW
ncbi:hypothetical protein [Actinoplanes regularis]|nr:hypothetical protein [Actinoplanes regularis]